QGGGVRGGGTSTGITDRLPAPAGLSGLRPAARLEPADDGRHHPLEAAGDEDVEEACAGIRPVAEIVRHACGDAHEGVARAEVPGPADEDLRLALEHVEDLVVLRVGMGADAGLAGLEQPFGDAVALVRLGL